METLEQYRQIVRDLLASHATNDDPEIECQAICNPESDRYLLVDVGWQGLNRIYACYMHLGQNLDPAQYDGGRSRGRVGGQRGAPRRYCLGSASIV